MNSLPPARHLLLIAGLAALVLPGFTGCTSPTDGAHTDRPPSGTASSTNGFSQLKEGLTEVEVRQLVGDPQSTRPFVSTQGITCTVWIYEHKISENVIQVPISTREVPLMNPLTGVMGSTQEAVYANEHQNVIESVEVLLLEHKVIGIKRQVRTDKNMVK